MSINNKAVKVELPITQTKHDIASHTGAPWMPQYY